MPIRVMYQKTAAKTNKVNLQFFLLLKSKRSVVGTVQKKSNLAHQNKIAFPVSPTKKWIETGFSNGLSRALAPDQEMFQPSERSHQLVHQFNIQAVQRKLSIISENQKPMSFPKRF
jgi:hypothetical protein